MVGSAGASSGLVTRERRWQVRVWEGSVYRMGMVGLVRSSGMEMSE
jgi:hypothetical protein